MSELLQKDAPMIRTDADAIFASAEAATRAAVVQVLHQHGVSFDGGPENTDRDISFELGFVLTGACLALGSLAGLHIDAARRTRLVELCASALEGACTETAGLMAEGAR